MRVGGARAVAAPSGSVRHVTNPLRGPGAPSSRPVAVTAVVVALALEAGLLLGVGLWLLYETFTAVHTSLGAAVTLVVLALGIGAALLAAARGLSHGRRWPRGLALTWQILQLSIVWKTFTGGPVWLAVALLVPVLVVGVGLFVPAVMRWTTPATRR